jgi:hypothetical protein
MHSEGHKLGFNQAVQKNAPRSRKESQMQHLAPSSLQGYMIYFVAVSPTARV